MKNLIALIAAMLMIGAPAFASPVRAHRPHKPRAAHHKKAHPRKARQAKRRPGKVVSPGDVVEMPHS